MRLDAFHGRVPILEEVERLSRHLHERVLGVAHIAVVEQRRGVLLVRAGHVIEDRKRVERLGRSRSRLWSDGGELALLMCGSSDGVFKVCLA